MQKAIPIYASIEGFSTRKDGTAKITIGTQELDDKQYALLGGLVNKQGWVYFSPTTLTDEQLDIPDVKPEFRGDKTKSQIQRAVLYRLWEQSNTGQEFELYYKIKMDKIIDALKEKLE